MTSLMSSGVKIDVETFYQSDYFNPKEKEFMFAYRITITNYNPFIIKIIGRKWHIFDGAEGYREVEGNGIVGMQPVISSGEEYQYVSGCNLNDELGAMQGEYIAENLNNKERFSIIIPSFNMEYPAKLN